MRRLLSLQGILKFVNLLVEYYPDFFYPVFEGLVFFLHDNECFSAHSQAFLASIHKLLGHFQHLILWLHAPNYVAIIICNKIHIWVQVDTSILIFLLLLHKFSIPVLGIR